MRRPITRPRDRHDEEEAARGANGLGQDLGILLPILAFVALGVQHVPANMGYFAVGLIHGGVGTTAQEAFFWNLLPATIGNLIGGGVLVALLFWYTFGGDPAMKSSHATAATPRKCTSRVRRMGGSRPSR